LHEVAESVGRVSRSVLNELPDVKSKMKNLLINNAERPQTREIGYEVLHEVTSMANWLNEEILLFTSDPFIATCQVDMAGNAFFAALPARTNSGRLASSCNT
jgi:hypothetical protein